MAGRGPAPKDPSERRRRNVVAPTVTVVDDGEVRGPELPEDIDWHPQTLAWWESMRTAPQAQTYTEADWSFLVDTAVLHSEFWLGNRALAPELRLRVAKFGVTPEDRARLKISVGKPDVKGSQARLQTKPAAPDRKGRLLKVVNGD